jgi:hypothetical protein
MPPVGFEPAIPASKWPQTHSLDRAATVIGVWYNTVLIPKIKVTLYLMHRYICTTGIRPINSTSMAHLILCHLSKGFMKKCCARELCRL